MGESVAQNGVTDPATALPEIITLIEHGTFEETQIEAVRKLAVPFRETEYEAKPAYLGIHPQTLHAGYYIGADWLTEKHAIVVKPKIPNLDFIGMFVRVLQFEPAANYFSKFYGIDFEKRPICSAAMQNRITPLLVIHYLALLKKLVGRGLKKDYVAQEENLQSKIKGRILIRQHLRTNTLRSRNDRVFCRYQEYTADTPENRLLKKAFLFAESYVRQLSIHNSYAAIRSIVRDIGTAFCGVSDTVSSCDLKGSPRNKLYREYAEATRVAKTILRRFHYSIAETRTGNDFTPVFWIDMSRLYEVYVYAKLCESYRDAILFQVPGYCRTAADFLKKDENLIIDTKYKPRYDQGNGGMLDDIRQLCAYARDRKILRQLSDPDAIPSCLIVYPEKVQTEDEENKTTEECRQVETFRADRTLLEQASPVSGFHRFYKISVPLPVTAE